MPAREHFCLSLRRRRKRERNASLDPHRKSATLAKFIVRRVTLTTLQLVSLLALTETVVVVDPISCGAWVESIADVAEAGVERNLLARLARCSA